MDIIGSGGGGGGSPHTPVEANDTLQSRQMVKLLFAVSEGEISALDDILLNNVPIANFDATFEFRSGTVGQSVIPGFIDTEQPVPSFSPVNIVTGTEYFTSLAYNNTSCRITLTLNGLQETLANGDTIGYRVDFALSTRPSTSSTWTQVATITKKGKASSAYSWDTIVPAPAGVTIASNWEVKLVRTTPTDTSKQVSTASWASAIAITESNLTYDNTALVGITLNDADQFGGNIPEVTFKLKGLKVKIPTNYDPVAHTYDETVPWDLSLTEGLFHYTANPAWHIYMVLNASRYGLNIAKADIDVVSLYELSKYCDELISDGKGGQERRYELHNQFYTREEPSVLLMHLLTICNANFTSNEFGQISIMFDRPGQAVTKQITNANIIEGEFSYSSAEINSRYNLVNVTYNRVEFNGRTDTANATEPTLVSRYGLQTSDIVLAGCISEAQAVRKARWAIYTSSYLPNIISFKTLFAGLNYHVGDLVRVFDNENQGDNVAGLLVSFSQVSRITTLQLDRTVTLTNDPYTVYFLDVDGVTEKSYPIGETNTSTSTVSFLALATPAVNSTFILTGAVKDRVFKVVKITKNEDVYEIDAAEHKEEKYTYIDQAITVAQPTGDFIDIGEFLTVPVTGITVVENFSSNGVTQNSTLDITWDWVKGALKYNAGFALTWRRDSQESNYVKELFGTTYSIPNPVPGLYEITVWAVNPVSGIRSTPFTSTYNFRSSSGTSSLQPPQNVFVAGTSGLTFKTKDLNLTFTYDPANANVSDALLDYVIEVWDASVTVQKGDYSAKPDTSKGGSFSFPFTENIDRFGTATRTFVIKVFSRDVIGDLSLPVQVTVTNPVPAAVSFSIISGSEASYLNITSSTDTDLAGYLAYRDTATFTPSQATLLSDGLDTSVTLSGVSGQQYFYNVAAYDTFGKTGLNFSGEQSSTMLSSTVDTWVFTGLIFKPNDPVTNKVSWTAGSASKNGATPVAIAAGSSTTAWASGIQYFYYDGTSGTLSVTTDITIAVNGVQVLATYKGGTLLTVGNGDAYTDGGLILANTVGANQLVASSAIITNTAQLGGLVVAEAAIANAAVTNAKIGGFIESSNYSTVTKTGWKIDKAGDISSYGAFSLYDSSGNLVFGSNNPTLDYSRVAGTKPPANADITANNISAGVVNQQIFRLVTYYWTGVVPPIVGGIYDEAGNDLRGLSGNPRSYTLSIYDRVTKTFDSHTQYDVYGIGAATPGFDATKLATDLNALTNTKIVFLLGGHEPVANRLTGGLPIAIYRCGGSRTVFENGNWAGSLGGYILVGVPGSGEGKGNEYFAGGDSDGWLDVQVVLKNGNIVSQGSTEFNIAQNATNGADYATNVANKPTSLSGINSTEGTKLTGIAAGADVTSASPQSPSWLSSPVVWSGNQISSSNISTYMASAAIGNAQIDRASVNKLKVVTADIVDLSVETIKIKDNSITMTAAANGGFVAADLGTAWKQLVTVTATVPANAIQRSVIVFLSGVTGFTSNGVSFRILRNGVVIKNFGISSGAFYSSILDIVPATGNYIYSAEFMGDASNGYNADIYSSIITAMVMVK